MAPLRRQATSKNSAGLGGSSNGYVNSFTLNTATQNGADGAPMSSPAADNFLFLAIACNGSDANITAVTDSASNTWTEVGEFYDPARSPSVDANQYISCWVTKPATTAHLTISMTAASAVQWGVFLNEYTGAVTSSWVRTSGSGIISSQYGQSHSVTAAASSLNGDLSIAVFNVSHTNESWNVGSGYTNLQTTGAATGLQYLSAAIEDRVQSATGVQSATIGTQGYDKGVAFIAVIKPLVTSAPNPPTDLNASPGNQAAAMSWTAPQRATSFTVRRATNPAGPFTTVGSNLTDPSYTATGLTNGTPYYFTVSATNTVGESAQTAFAPVTPAVPGAVVFSDWYPNGVKPSLTGAAMRLDARNQVLKWFGYVLTSELTAGTPIPQNSRLPGPVKRIKAPDQGFYPDENSRNGTVSEGQSYGALFCAVLSNPALPAGTFWPDAKATFDSLYRFYDANKNERGVMNWHILANGTPGDLNGALDGEEDMIEALRIMSEMHGDAGAINYGAEADKLMKAVEDYEFVPETGYAFANGMTPGDNWGFNTDVYMPDYARIGYWLDWSNWLRKRGKTARADRWLRIREKNITHIQYYIDSSTWTAGVPDRQTRTYGTIGGDFNNQVTYNSVRLGFGWMLEHLRHGAAGDPRAKQYMDKIANRFKQVFTTGGNVKAPNYSPDLSNGGQGYSNGSGYGYALSVSLGLVANQTFATELFNAAAASNEPASSYFNGAIICYSLLVASGALQSFATAGTTPPDPDDPPVPSPPIIEGVFKFWTGSAYSELRTPASSN